ncbi:TSPc domain-containing protein [Plantibacter sp. RU18]
MRHSSSTAHNRWRWRLGIGGGVLALLVAGGAYAVHTFGPKFGVYIVPPSPERYADIALEMMEEGYYAKGAEWDAARAEVKQAAIQATNYQELHAPLAQAASVAGGKHSFFFTPTEAEALAENGSAKFIAPTVSAEAGVTTITVPELGDVSTDQQAEYAEAAVSGISSADARTCGWIIDVRGNIGGNMFPMLSGVSPLLPNGQALSFVTNTGTKTVVTIQDDGAGIEGSTLLTIPKMQKVAERPIAVLQDARTASSGEAILTAFRGLSGVEFFGTASAGYTSANIFHRLHDGAVLVLTSSMYVDRDGTNLKEQPVQPGVEIAPEQAPQAAIDWLNAQGCS